MKITSAEFKDAFLKGKISRHQQLMLKLNYNAKSHTLTSKKLAKELGYNHHGSANLHYGKLASKIGEILKIEKMPTEKIGIFVFFFKLNEEWNWILKPEVCQALEELNWVELQEFVHPEEVLGSELTEGTSKSVSVNIYERNPIARSACINYYGSTCQICKTDLGKIYGAVGQDFIHVHHIIELSEIGKSYKVDPINDLLPVCPNCHAMLHRRKPAFTPSELKQLIEI